MDDQAQQPIARTVGRRKPSPVGRLPSAGARTAMDALAAGRLTRAPKGVFRYASHREMARDRERWEIEAIVEMQRRRG